MADRPDHDITDRPTEVLAELLHHRATQNAIVRSYGIMPSSRPEDDDLDRAAAARLRQLTDENDRWQEEARQYAENADYWRDRLNDHKASLAIQAFTAPDEDEAVMMESLVARIGDLLAERDEYRRQLDTLRNAIEKLIPWAESYRMHHVVMALRELLALAAVGDPEEGR